MPPRPGGVPPRVRPLAQQGCRGRALEPAPTMCRDRPRAGRWSRLEQVVGRARTRGPGADTPAEYRAHDRWSVPGAGWLAARPGRVGRSRGRSAEARRNRQLGAVRRGPTDGCRAATPVRSGHPPSPVATSSLEDGPGVDPARETRSLGGRGRAAGGDEGRRPVGQRTALARPAVAPRLESSDLPSATGAVSREGPEDARDCDGSETDPRTRSGDVLRVHLVARGRGHEPGHDPGRVREIRVVGIRGQACSPTFARRQRCPSRVSSTVIPLRASASRRRSDPTQS